MIRQLEPVAPPREKNDHASYHAVHPSARKAAFGLRRGLLHDLFYWHELKRVSYNPTPGDEPGELLLLSCNSYRVTIRGHRLGLLLEDFQEELVDFIRVSSKQAQMGGAPANEPVISSIVIVDLREGG
jgi:hypothetical protein